MLVSLSLWNWYFVACDTVDALMAKESINSMEMTIAIFGAISFEVKNEQKRYLVVDVCVRSMVIGTYDSSDGYIYNVKFKRQREQARHLIWPYVVFNSFFSFSFFFKNNFLFNSFFFKIQ